MAKRIVKITAEDIPQIQEKILTLINREIDLLFLPKEDRNSELTEADKDNLKDFSTLIKTIYVDYRAEVKALKLELKDLPKEDLLKIIKADANG